MANLCDTCIQQMKTTCDLDGTKLRVVPECPYYEEKDDAVETHIRKHFLDYTLYGEEMWEEVHFNGRVYDCNLYLREEFDSSWKEGDALPHRVDVYSTYMFGGYRWSDLTDIVAGFCLVLKEK